MMLVSIEYQRYLAAVDLCILTGAILLRQQDSSHLAWYAAQRQHLARSVLIPVTLQASGQSPDFWLCALRPKHGQSLQSPSRQL